MPVATKCWLHSANGIERKLDMTNHIDNPGYAIGNGVFYLWHLQAAGLVGADPTIEEQFEKPFKFWTDSLPEDPELGARVAIIDNGCTDLTHPNLNCKIEDRIEFSGFLEGSVYGEDQRNVWGDPGIFQAADLPLEAIVRNNDEISPALKDALLQLDRGSLDAHRYHELQDPTRRFSAHGTSTAGLVAADIGAESNPKFPSMISYCGLNPSATVIPINTVYSADYAPVIMGLLYAVAKKVDIILMPRNVHEIADPGPLNDHKASVNPRATRKDLQGRSNAERKVFEFILKKVSEHIPVVIAAGNTGSEEVVYPGRLKFEGDDDDRIKDLFVAGAGTAFGSIASYSSGGRKDGVLLMPSDDAQIMNQKFNRPNEQDWRSRHMETKAIGHHEGQDPFPHCPYAVLTIDIPGQYGYASQGREDTDYQDSTGAANAGAVFMSDGNKEDLTKEAAYRSLYTVFGGTSAASAILAGILSLCQNRYKMWKGSPDARLSGTQLAELVQKAGTSDWIPVVGPLEGNPSYESALQILNIEALLQLVFEQD